MKFAILTDIHLGPEVHYKGVLRKMSKNVKPFLEKFIAEMNCSVKPEFLIVLGDLVGNENEFNDKNNISYIIDTLKKLDCPVHYVAGNHDLKHISEEDLTKLFRLDRLYYSFDSSDLHFIVLFSKVIVKGNIRITDEQKDWLINDLDNTSKKCVVFVHHSLADQDLTGNPWFEGKPEKSLIANRLEIREVLEKSGKVIGVFNGHLHWDKHDVHNNTPYFTIQSLIENENDLGIASETHAVVNIVDDKFYVDVKGNYPKKFLHPK